MSIGDSFFIAHKPTKSLRGTLVNVKDPLPTPEQRNVVNHIPGSDCPNAYVHQTGRQLSALGIEHKGAVRRQDENSLLALHCLMTGHAFDWDRAPVIGKGTTKHTRDIIEAWNTTSTCVNKCVTLDPGNRALRDYWRRRRQGHPKSPPPHFSCFHCFDKPDPSHTDSIYTGLSLHPFNCTRNSPHRHLTKCHSYRFENL